MVKTQGSVNCRIGTGIWGIHWLKFLQKKGCAVHRLLLQGFHSFLVKLIAFTNKVIACLVKYIADWGYFHLRVKLFTWNECFET